MILVISHTSFRNIQSWIPVLVQVNDVICLTKLSIWAFNSLAPRSLKIVPFSHVKIQTAWYRPTCVLHRHQPRPNASEIPP